MTVTFLEAIPMRKVLLALVLAAWAGQAMAAPSPQDMVKSLDDALLAAMKGGKAAGFKGRAAVIEPVIDQVFDLPEMTRLTLGSAGKALTPEQTARMVESFRLFSIASYAKNFDSFTGEHFEMGEPRPGGAGAIVVPTQLYPGDGSQPVELDYVLKVSGDQWKVTDVLAEGAVSQMAARRVEFGTILRKDGPDALIKALDAKTKALASDR